MATILMIGNKHVMSHNQPRHSDNAFLFPKKFPFGRFPLESFWPPLEALGNWQPSLKSYQLIHGFNAIPYTNKPFIVSFEIFIPHILSSSQDRAAKILENILINRLKMKNCKKIIASSEYAKKRFIKKIETRKTFEQIKDKLVVIPVNAKIISARPKKISQEELELIFVGNHFARKGGIAVLRLANKALKERLPIKIKIISSLRLGKGVPTDFPDKKQYDLDLKLMDIENVSYYKSLPNQEVIQLLHKSHFQIIPSLQDIAAFSVVEGLSTATPAIGSNIGAIPEWIADSKNGYIIDLPVDENQMWKGWREQSQVSDREYWEILSGAYDNLANQAFQKLAEFFNREDKQEYYENLSQNALFRAREYHDSEKTSKLLDRIYYEAINS